MDRLSLFPDTTTINHKTLSIGGCSLTTLAEQYGTPLYIYDRSTLDNALTAYQTALRKFYPGESSLVYGGKAFLCLAMAEWTKQHDLWLDCSGLGEIAIAVVAEVLRERILVHGVNKSERDLEAACEQAGVVVVDNLTELLHLVKISRQHSVPQLWLRFQPGQVVETHAFTQTGQAGSKFGMDAKQVLNAVRLCQEQGLAPGGLHFHLGSQFRDPAPLVGAIEKALDLAKTIGFEPPWCFSPGGGWGVAYHEEDLPQPDLEGYLHLVSETVVKGCKKRDLSLPNLFLEPGRSLVARAGVALYRVGTVKQTADRNWVLLDGGMADNIRPALYGARYSALPVRDPERPVCGPVWFGGPYCESGDVLIEGLPFPQIQEGDLVAVPVSGAYQVSMSSNYNGARRPAVIWLDHGESQLIQARETTKDLFRRDFRLVKPAGTE
jgi:diaminopimelate decarboxylase